GRGSLSISGRGAAGYLPAFRKAVATLFPWTRGTAVPLRRYRILDLTFDSDVELRVPVEFEFVDRSGNLHCHYVTAMPHLAGPDWSSLFGLGAATSLTFAMRGTQTRVRASADLTVEEIHDGAVANSPASRSELFAASARVEVGDRWLELRYQAR